MVKPHDEVIRTALSTITERGKEYGTHVSSFARTAVIASQITGKEIGLFEVAAVMTAIKLARIGKSRTHMDSYVDGIAYLGFLAEFAQLENIEGSE